MRRKTQTLFMLVVAGLVVRGGLVVPSEAELEARRADVEALTKADYAALDGGTMTHSELADQMVDYARNAGDPVAAFLLRRAAFRQYVVGGAVVAAVRFHDRMARTAGGEYALALARFSSKQLARQVSLKTEGAKEFVDRLAGVERRVRAVEAARARAEEAPDDPLAREKYAASLALLDDWPRALEEFARLGGRARELALFERRYPRTGVTLLTTADVAENWWGYPETASLPPEDAQVFRRHAAKWYRLAVANGVLRGERRQLAERRAAEAGGTP